MLKGFHISVIKWLLYHFITMVLYCLVLAVVAEMLFYLLVITNPIKVTLLVTWPRLLLYFWGISLFFHYVYGFFILFILTDFIVYRYKISINSHMIIFSLINIFILYVVISLNRSFYMPFRNNLVLLATFCIATIIYPYISTAIEKRLKFIKT
jgi:hypothetical protein